MKILVLLDKVVDTGQKICLNAANDGIDFSNLQYVINPWDEFALTRAIELKELYPQQVEKIAVAHVGTAQSDAVVRKALAIGADEAFRINYEPADAMMVAQQLTQVAADYDLILSGVEGSDFNTSAVGAMLAEMLNIESIGSVSGVDLLDDRLKITREINGRQEFLSARTPILLVVQKGIANQVRIANMRGIMSAKSKPFSVLQPVDFDSAVQVVSMNYPPKKGKCKMIPADEAAELIKLLHEEARVI